MYIKENNTMKDLSNYYDTLEKMDDEIYKLEKKKGNIKDLITLISALILSLGAAFIANSIIGFKELMTIYGVGGFLFTAGVSCFSSIIGGNIISKIMTKTPIFNSINNNILMIKLKQNELINSQANDMIESIKLEIERCLNNLNSPKIMVENNEENDSTRSYVYDFSKDCKKSYLTEIDTNDNIAAYIDLKKRYYIKKRTRKPNYR